MQAINIVASTITMLAPNNTYPARKAKDKEHTANFNLIKHEALLRKKAYATFTIKINETFFDDSDMVSEYFLVVVYEELLQIPLLSARYYYDKTIIENYLKGDLGAAPCFMLNKQPFNLVDYSDDSILLADRLSGNITHPFYRKYRIEILNAFYSEIKKNNFNNTIVLMVRENKQVKKYIALGFQLIGSVIHKGVLHSVIITKILP